jgi:hypothetical protein
MDLKWTLVKFKYIDNKAKTLEDYEIFEEGMEPDNTFIKWLHKHFNIRALLSITWYDATSEVTWFRRDASEE